MLIIYLEKSYNIFLNSKKNKSCTIINYIKIMLILCLIDANVLINILIIKKNKIVIYKSIYCLY